MPKVLWIRQRDSLVMAGLVSWVCCRSKDHFHWTAPLYSLYPADPKSGGHCSPHPSVAPPMNIAICICQKANISSVLLSRPFFRSRDQDRDLGHQVSRPIPRPGQNELECTRVSRVETMVSRSQDCILRTGSQSNYDVELEWLLLLKFMCKYCIFTMDWTSTISYVHIGQYYYSVLLNHTALRTATWCTQTGSWRHLDAKMINEILYM